MAALDRKQLRPIDCPGLIRLGLPKDGGYVVPDAAVRSSTTLVSLGVNEDWSFDKAFLAVNAAVRVVAVDHTVGPWWFVRRIGSSLLGVLRSSFVLDRRKVRKHTAILRNAVDYFAFFRGPHRHVRKRAGAADTSAAISIGRLLEALDAQRDHSVFVKVDVEGAEYDLIADIVRCEAQINCVVIEFHDVNRRTAMFNQAVAHLLDHFRIVHVHGNNYSGYDARNDFPDAVEMTFLHAALVAGAPAPSSHEYPRPGLDFPNRPRRPDYRLRFQ